MGVDSLRRGFGSGRDEEGERRIGGRRGEASGKVLQFVAPNCKLRETVLTFSSKTKISGFGISFIFKIGGCTQAACTKALIRRLKVIHKVSY